MSHYGGYKLKIALKNAERIEQALQEIARQREGFSYTHTTTACCDEFVTHYEDMEVFRKDNLRIKRTKGSDVYEIQVDLYRVEDLTRELTDEIAVAYQYAAIKRSLAKQRFTPRVSRETGKEVCLTARGY
jgi:hypothetical protein